MSVRFILFLFLSVLLSGGLFVVGLLANMFAGTMGAFAYVPMIGFFFVALLLLLWIVLRLRKQDDENSTRLPKLAFTACVALPLISCLLGGSSLLSKISDGWGYLTAPSESVAALPSGNSWVSFYGDGKLLLADIDNQKLVHWQPVETSKVEDVFDKGYFLSNQTLVGANGKSYSLIFDNGDTKFPSDLSLTESGAHLTWKVNYEKDEQKKGIFLRELSNDAEKMRLSPYGVNPIVMTDGKTMFFGDNLGLVKVVEKEVSHLYQPGEGFYVNDLALSPDGKQIAFRVKDTQPGIKGQDSINIIDLEGNLTEIYKTTPGAKAEEPQWSNDGKQLAFRYTPPGSDPFPVPTLMVSQLNGTAPLQLAMFEKGIFLRPAGVQDFSWSPDGTRIAFVAALKGSTFLENEGGDTSHKFDLYVINSNGTGLRRITKLNQEYKRHNSHMVVWWDQN